MARNRAHLTADNPDRGKIGLVGGILAAALAALGGTAVFLGSGHQSSPPTQTPPTVEQQPPTPLEVLPKPPPDMPPTSKTDKPTKPKPPPPDPG